MAIIKTPFGNLPDGRAVTRYTLAGKGGLCASVLDYGATLQSLLFAGKDVLLGYENAADYANAGGGYLGATVGRYANRIAGGMFTLNGKVYTLANNEPGRAHLHGGNVGFDKMIWEMDILDTGDEPTLRASLFSPDGEEGYPGNLKVTVTFKVSLDNTLSITYTADSDADTVINFTNHAYFNLNGFDGGDILDTVVSVNADYFTAVDDLLIPTELTPVDGTPFDFRQAKPLSDAIHGDHPQIKLAGGVDHNFAVNGEIGTLREAIKAHSPKSGIEVTCLTDLPGVQIYTANWLEKDFGKGGPMTRFQGFCMETQFYPDTPNRPDFPSCVLKAGEKFESVTAFHFEMK